MAVCVALLNLGMGVCAGVGCGSVVRDVVEAEAGRPVGGTSAYWRG